MAEGGLGGDGSQIFGVPQGEDGDHHEWEEDQQAAKGSVLAEHLGHVEHHDHEDDQVDARDEHEQEPEPFPAEDFQLDEGVIDGDEGGPAGLAGLGEQLPHAKHIKGSNDQGKEERDKEPSRRNCRNDSNNPLISPYGK